MIESLADPELERGNPLSRLVLRLIACWWHAVCEEEVRSMNRTRAPVIHSEWQRGFRKKNQYTLKPLI